MERKIWGRHANGNEVNHRSVRIPSKKSKNKSKASRNNWKMETKYA